MPTLEEVLAFRRAMFDKSLALVKKKGADYNRDQQHKEALFNLKVSALLGIVPTSEVGVLIRLTDKLMRLISLMKTRDREPKVLDESLLDTLADAHNYLDYAYLLWAEGRRETDGAPRSRSLRGSVHVT